MSKVSQIVPWIIITILICIVIALILYNVFIAKQICDEECRLAQYEKGKADGQKQSIILLNQYNNKQVKVSDEIENSKSIDKAQERDIRVLQDPLYPPVNRSESSVYNMTRTAIDQKKLYVQSANYNDSFRLVGYLTSNDERKDSGGNSWKMFARQIYSNKSEFYLMPTNNNYDIKIPITDDIIASGYRLRDIYDIPSTIRFNTPLLNISEYTFIELPRNNLDGIRV